ncbi:MAG TPA: DUF3293 domain-containing protein [Gemmatimonadaceae bacterium]|jgi:hypothetical protein|nr:DUF3293 domain-containing protein [Gemmatimonadaceae bacterium]
MNEPPEMRDPDWPLYAETVLTFATRPAVEIDLRKIPSESVLAQLRMAGLDQPFAIITAFDPEGKDLSRADNDRRKEELDRRLSSLGYDFVHVDCCSPDRSHCECSVAVTMPRQTALDLAREMRQVAIFWFDGKLFWILGALADSDPLMLPRSS